MCMCVCVGGGEGAKQATTNHVKLLKNKTCTNKNKSQQPALEGTQHSSLGMEEAAAGCSRASPSVLRGTASATLHCQSEGRGVPREGHGGEESAFCETPSLHPSSAAVSLLSAGRCGAFPFCPGKNKKNQKKKGGGRDGV